MSVGQYLVIKFGPVITITLIIIIIIIIIIKDLCKSHNLTGHEHYWLIFHPQKIQFIY